MQSRILVRPYTTRRHAVATTSFTTNVATSVLRLGGGGLVLVLDLCLLEFLGHIDNGILLLGEFGVSVGGAVDLLVLGSRLLRRVLGASISTLALGSVKLLELLLGLFDVLEESNQHVCLRIRHRQ